MSDEALNTYLAWRDKRAKEQESEHDPLDLASRMFTLCDMADSEMVRQWAVEVRELLNELDAGAAWHCTDSLLTANELATLKRENERYKQMLEYIADDGVGKQVSARAVLDEVALLKEPE